MENSYYTLIPKTVDCPMWKEKITVTAKYRFSKLHDPFCARFVGATCEVLENLKLPEHKKDKRLSLYRFCRMASNCPYHVKGMCASQDCTNKYNIKKYV